MSQTLFSVLTLPSGRLVGAGVIDFVASVVQMRALWRKRPGHWGSSAWREPAWGPRARVGSLGRSPHPIAGWSHRNCRGDLGPLHAPGPCSEESSSRADVETELPLSKRRSSKGRAGLPAVPLRVGCCLARSHAHTPCCAASPPEAAAWDRGETGRQPSVASAAGARESPGGVVRS